MPTKKLADGSPYEKATHHGDGVLNGSWSVTKKIDGVRALRLADGTVVSRNSKPLYNLNHLRFQDAEIFRKDWNTSVSLVRSQSPQVINQGDVYPLAGIETDQRLVTSDVLIDSTQEERELMMQKYVDQGYEGIVLRHLTSNKWVKVVPWKTVDVRITSYEMSEKRRGYIKSFDTAHGKIPATGFPTAALDIIAYDHPKVYVGQIAEVKFREWTVNNKMRFPAFVRWRFDKDEESLT